MSSRHVLRARCGQYAAEVPGAVHLDYIEDLLAGVDGVTVGAAILDLGTRGRYSRRRPPHSPTHGNRAAHGAGLRRAAIGAGVRTLYPYGPPIPSSDDRMIEIWGCRGRRSWTAHRSSRRGFASPHRPPARGYRRNMVDPALT